MKSFYRDFKFKLIIIIYLNHNCYRIIYVNLKNLSKHEEIVFRDA